MNGFGQAEQTRPEKRVLRTTFLRSEPLAGRERGFGIETEQSACRLGRYRSGT